MLEERKKKRQKIAFISYVPDICYQQDQLFDCTFFNLAKNNQVSFLAIFFLKLLFWN